MGLFDFLTYKKFNTYKWQKYGLKKRVKLFQKMEKIMAKKMKRPMFYVVPQDFGSDINGQCNYAEQVIYINGAFFTEPNLQFYGLATLFHEERHAQQHNIVKSKKYICRFSKAYKWRQNMLGYINYDGNDKYSYYSMQEIERDANKYAIERLKKLEYWWRKDKYYYKTLELKIQQFGDVKNLAKKELGIFYKWKLKRRQKKELKKNGEE